MDDDCIRKKMSGKFQFVGMIRKTGNDSSRQPF